MRFFHFVPQRKQRKFSGLQKQKSAHFSFAAAQCVTHCLSGRKVACVSVTEGACGTEGGRNPPFSGVFRSIPHPLRRMPLSQGSHESVRFSALCRKISPAAATAALFKGRLFLCKSYGCKGSVLSKRFPIFRSRKAEGLPFFATFSLQSEGFRFRFGQRAQKARSRVRVFVSPKCLCFSESHPRPYTCAAPPARSHCRRHSDSSPESPRPFCRLPDRSR